MNKRKYAQLSLSLAAMLMAVQGVQSVKAESLFVLGTSSSFYAEPKSLFGAVRARSVGDIVTIVLSENINFNDSLNYTSDRSSNTVDNFTNFFNKILNTFNFIQKTLVEINLDSLLNLILLH